MAMPKTPMSSISMAPFPCLGPILRVRFTRSTTIWKDRVCRRQIPELPRFHGFASSGCNRSSDRGGSVARVTKGRAAGKAGPRSGDVIVAVNREPVRSVETQNDAVDETRTKHRKPVLLLVSR